MAASSSSSSSGSMGSRVAIDAFNAACKRLEKKGNVTSEDIVELESLRKGIATIFEREITTLRGTAGAGTTGAEGRIQSKIKDRDTELTKSDRAIEGFQKRIQSVVTRATGAGAGTGAEAAAGGPAAGAGTGARARATGAGTEAEPGAREIGAEYTGSEDLDFQIFSEYLSHSEVSKSARTSKGTRTIAHQIIITKLNSLREISPDEIREYAKLLSTDFKGVLEHCIHVTHLDFNIASNPRMEEAMTAELPDLESISFNSGLSFSTTVLTAFLTQHPQVRSLTLRGSSCRNEDLLAIADARPELTSIDCSGNWVGNYGMTGIATYCKDLTFLAVNDCRTISGPGIADIAMGCPKLTTLEARSCDSLTDDDMPAVAEHCRNLTSLDVSYCRNISDVGLARIAAGCPELHSLNVMGCEQISEDGIAAFVALRPNVIISR